ncbi:MAG: hypothetical protein RLP15_00910 [Cryomorphaceae bacterium]
MQKYNIIMERFWLVVAIGTFIFAVYQLGKFGLASSGISFIMALVAASLFYLRYYMRKRHEREQEKDS